jgi:hypothetical protein
MLQVGATGIEEEEKKEEEEEEYVMKMRTSCNCLRTVSYEEFYTQRW